MIDIIVEALEKHQLNLSDEVVQAVATDIENAISDDKHSMWSKEAFNFLSEVVHILEQDKAAIIEDTVERTELGVLIFKIQEHLLKNK